MEKTYVVWSPDKVLWDLHEKVDTYQGLINAKKNTNAQYHPLYIRTV